MKDRIKNDLTAAMKAGDKTRTMVLRGVLAEISRYEVEKETRREADEAAIIQLIKRERARREETIDFARKGNRADIVAQNEAEIKVLEGYLPAVVSADEVSATIKEAIAAGASQMGSLMKALRDKFGPRLDGKMASELAKQALAGKS